MQYDPIKRKLGVFFNRTPLFRKIFYLLLDILLLRSWHIRKVLRLWAKVHRGPQEVLDAGSGFGQYDYYMARLHPDWQIKGVDVKSEQVADSNSFFSTINLKNANFVKADLTSFNEEDTYDLVLCVDVMEHIEDDEKVLLNLNKALKKKGMLLISTPSDQGGSDVHHHDDHHGDEPHSFIDEHVRDGYGIEEITDKLKKAGFTTTEVYYQYGFPGKIAWKLSMKYPIMMLNMSAIFFILLPFYYLLTFPFVLLLNYADLKVQHKTGTGLIAKAWK